MSKKQEEKKDSTRAISIIALVLVVIVILTWFFSHLHITSDKLDQKKIMYDCPGVGLKERLCEPLCYIGCSEVEINSGKPNKNAIAIYWD